MANSKYEYVRMFEKHDTLLPNTWIVVRIDGRGFHKLSNHYNFSKPNDNRALDVMNAAAIHILKAIPDITFAYGVSDEFSFVFDKSTTLFERRHEKLVSTVVSTFTAAYMWSWQNFFDPIRLELDKLPTFDGRSVCFPELGNVRDYLSWRQVDCHINNLYNTTFWTMVQQGGMSNTEAEKELKGTLASDKNEILWSRFGVNYNDEPEIWKKGSVVFRDLNPQHVAGLTTNNAGEQGACSVPLVMSKTRSEKLRKARQKASIEVMHCDIIKNDFWDQRPWILGNGRSGNV